MRLRKVFYGLGKAEKIEARVEQLMAATPLTDDETTLGVESRRAVALCELLQTNNHQIDKYDKSIKELVVQHQDFEIFGSLPAGSHATQARLIAALGDDRSCYESAELLQAAIWDHAIDNAERPAAFRLQSLGLQQVQEANVS
ncbi:hypothetical protein SH139x_004787 [Planctomycetaceae bacterium SH139]